MTVSDPREDELRASYTAVVSSSSQAGCTQSKVTDLQ